MTLERLVAGGRTDKLSPSRWLPTASRFRTQTGGRAGCRPVVRIPSSRGEVELVAQLGWRNSATGSSRPGGNAYEASLARWIFAHQGGAGAGMANWAGSPNRADLTAQFADQRVVAGAGAGGPPRAGRSRRDSSRLKVYENLVASLTAKLRLQTASICRRPVWPNQSDASARSGWPRREFFARRGR